MDNYMEIIPGLVIYFLLVVLILRQFLTSAGTVTGNQEARRLTLVLIAGLCIKLLIVTLWYVNRGDNYDPVWDDTYKYDQSGLYLANQFEQFIFYNKKYLETLGAHPGYNYLVGLVYLAYGHVPLVVSAFNILTVTLFSILAYFIAFRLFDANVARYTLLGNLFFPNYIPFEFFILKDTFVALGVVFIVWGVYRAAETKRMHDYLLPLATVPLLYFFRGELTVVLLGVLLLNEVYVSLGKGSSLRRSAVVLAFLGFCLFAQSYLKPSDRTALDRLNEINLGASAYGGTQIPPFLDGATGITDIVIRIATHPVQFVFHSLKSLVLLLFGPTYFYAQSGAEWFYKYGRFVLWDNLAAVVKIVFAPMMIYGFFHIVRHYRNKAFIIYFFPLLWFFGLLLAQDFFRWAVPALPFAVMIGAVGCTQFQRIKPFYVPYLLLMLCFMVINATRQDSLAMGGGLLLMTLAGMGWVYLGTTRASFR